VVRWTIVDNPALDEVAMRARMGMLFIDVKT
jgi:hypothetical protein